MLKLNHFLLYLTTDFGKNCIIMTLMSWHAKSAIEFFINFTTVLDFCVFMLLAEEASRYIHKVLKFIYHVFLNLLLF